MRLYMLWKIDHHTEQIARLDEEEGMPRLFEHAADAQAYGLRDPQAWGEELLVVPVTVGQA
jgi:hypothetical protein